MIVVTRGGGVTISVWVTFRIAVSVVVSMMVVNKGGEVTVSVCVTFKVVVRVSVSVSVSVSVQGIGHLLVVGLRVTVVGVKVIPCPATCLMK